MLQYLTRECPHFAAFMYKHVRNKASTVLYMDMCTPGQANRPDLGRAFEGIYYTFFEWPEWFRRRSKNWFVFGYVLKCDLKDIDCACSALCKFIFEQMWIHTQLHTVGMEYSVPGHASATHLRLHFSFHSLHGWFGSDSRSDCLHIIMFTFA